jgi:hypothetical protein
MVRGHALASDTPRSFVTHTQTVPSPSLTPLRAVASADLWCPGAKNTVPHRGHR